MTIGDVMLSLLTSVLGSILGTLILQRLGREKRPPLWHQPDATSPVAKKDPCGNQPQGISFFWLSMTIVDFYTQYNTFMLFCKDKFLTPPPHSR